jgi:tetratricopeptide (TPR) repeat protein
LLSLMSFFDRQGIPVELLRTHTTMTNGDRNHGVGDDEARNERGGSDDNGEAQSRSGIDGYMDDVMMLRDYSFISVDTDGETLQIHGLVQLAMRSWLRTHQQLEKWKEIYIKKLYVAFPTGEYENWKQCQALFPHVQSALGQRPDRKASLEEWALLLHEAACYVLLRGNLVDAEQLATKAMEAGIELFGARHPDTLLSMGNLASTYSAQGRWKEAEQLGVQVVETRKRVLGEDHPNTLASIANLALIFWKQGRWKEAAELGEQVVKACKRVLGEDHPDTLISMNNLALTYGEQDQLKEAAELRVQVLEACKRVLGEDHPNTLTSMGNLASTYSDQGRYEEAEELEVHVVETRKTVLGEDHPDTLRSIANLASTYSYQGRWKEAEELEVHVMEVRKRVLGEDHPDTIASMHDLSKLLAGQKSVEQLSDSTTPLGTNIRTTWLLWLLPPALLLVIVRSRR